MVIAFLRVMHNLVLCHYPRLEDTEVVTNCITEVVAIFLASSR
jgi:hypothetical protein